jgi:heat shock protein HtpX
MGAAIGLILLSVVILVLWNVYVGLYGAPPLVVRDGPYGLDAWVPVAVLIVGIVLLASLPLLIEKLRPTGGTFRDQIGANQRNATLLVLGVLLGLALVLDVLVTVVTLRTSAGLVAAGLGVLLGLLATWLAMRNGDRLVVRMAGARAVTHEQEPVLANVVAELATAANVPLPRLFVIDDESPNAFATGPDPERSSLIVTRGLLRDLDREELQGVIAHELAHIRNLDARYGLLVTVLLGSALLIVDGAFSIVTFPFRAVGQLVGAGGTPSGDGGVHVGGSGGSWSFPKIDLGDSDGDSDGGGAAIVLAIILFVLIVVFTVWLLKVIVPFVSRLARAAVGREREFLADASAVEIGRNPGALESALIKVATNRATLESVNRATASLCFVNPLRTFERRGRAIFATHPPTIDRVNRLRTLQGMPAMASIPGDVTQLD